MRMSVPQIMALWAALLAFMLVCRCTPPLLLRGRALSGRAERAIGLIPVAAFSALVANELAAPDAIMADPRAALVGLLSAAVVLVVACRSASLIWCALAGMLSYALLGSLILSGALGA